MLQPQQFPGLTLHEILSRVSCAGRSDHVFGMSQGSPKKLYLVSKKVQLCQGFPVICSLLVVVLLFTGVYQLQTSRRRVLAMACFLTDLYPPVCTECNAHCKCSFSQAQSSPVVVPLLKLLLAIQPLGGKRSLGPSGTKWGLSLPLSWGFFLSLSFFGDAYCIGGHRGCIAVIKVHCFLSGASAI